MSEIDRYEKGDREYYIHPITLAPYHTAEGAMEMLDIVGADKLVVAPLENWDIETLRDLDPKLVGNVEDTWHPLTTAQIFEDQAVERALHDITGALPIIREINPFQDIGEADAAYPWDNYFWGDAAEAEEKMKIIQERFGDTAIYSGHSPDNDRRWPDKNYAWEINPDHEIFDIEGILAVEGGLAIDMLHLMRGDRINGRKIAQSIQERNEILEILVKERENDIELIHLHLSVTDVVKAAMQGLPESIKSGLRILAKANEGTVPVAMQYMPPAPLNFFATTRGFVPRRILTSARETMDAAVYQENRNWMIPAYVVS